MKGKYHARYEDMRGDLDRVENEFISFHPEENIRTCGFEGAYRLHPEPGVVMVRAPARIHG